MIAAKHGRRIARHLKTLRSKWAKVEEKKISSFHGTDFPSKVILDGEVNGASDSNSGLLARLIIAYCSAQISKSASLQSRQLRY